jgi:hypothetical protein
MGQKNCRLKPRRDELLKRPAVIILLGLIVEPRMAGPNVLRINPRHTLTRSTLDRLLRPFKLRLTLAPFEPS